MIAEYLDAIRKLNAATTDAAKAALELRTSIRRLQLALHNAAKEVDPPVVFYLLPPGKDKHGG